MTTLTESGGHRYNLLCPKIFAGLRVGRVSRRVGMNKRKKVAMRKHRKRIRRLEERRKEAIRAGAPRLSKGKLKRLAGPPIPPVPR